jgi:thiamine biosynthesis lipoprotein
VSTTVFVLGVERGMQLVSRLPGVEAVIVDKDGRIFYSDGLTAPQ